MFGDKPTALAYEIFEKTVEKAGQIQWTNCHRLIGFKAIQFGVYTQKHKAQHAHNSLPCTRQLNHLNCYRELEP